ncbi:hypothetical protein DINM_005691 [Dirofilaria immitis]|nr:hypothetical protein [Dirofilaria immitis]
MYNEEGAKWRTFVQRNFGGGNFGSGTFNGRNASLCGRSLGGYGGNPTGYSGNYGGYGRQSYITLQNAFDAQDSLLVSGESFYRSETKEIALLLADIVEANDLVLCRRLPIMK